MRQWGLAVDRITGSIPRMPVAQDGNGCYQIVLYKSLAQGIETREALVTIVTFVKRRQLTFTRAVPYSSALRSSGPNQVQLSSYAYYLAFTARATDPITTRRIWRHADRVARAAPRDLVLQRVCENTRAKNGALDLAEQDARSEIEVRMNALDTLVPSFNTMYLTDDDRLPHKD